MLEYTQVNIQNRTPVRRAVQCSRATYSAAIVRSAGYQTTPFKGRPDSNLHGCKRCKHIQAYTPYSSNMSSKMRCFVIDDFYDNPFEVREFALKQQYEGCHLPRFHTKSFAQDEHREFFQRIIEPFAGKITYFEDRFNGSFQYSTSDFRGWCHVDTVDWAAIVFLSPDAPVACGTNFYAFHDGNLKTSNEITRKFSSDVTKWSVTDTLGNVFNRLIVYDATYFHRATNYFGTTKEDGRLFQVFFFNTEIPNRLS